MSVPFFARALFDYEAVEASELSVYEGDFLTVEEVNESGWCLARKGDENGWLPTDYVQRVSVTHHILMIKWTFFRLKMSPARH